MADGMRCDAIEGTKEQEEELPFLSSLDYHRVPAAFFSLAGVSKPAMLAKTLRAHLLIHTQRILRRRRHLRLVEY